MNWHSAACQPKEHSGGRLQTPAVSWQKQAGLSADVRLLSREPSGSTGRRSPAHAWTGRRRPPAEDTCPQRFRPPARSCLPGAAVATETGLGQPGSRFGCHGSALQRHRGYPASSWLEQSVLGRNPRADLRRAPFHALAIRLLLASWTGVFIAEE